MRRHIKQTVVGQAKAQYQSEKCQRIAKINELGKNLSIIIRNRFENARNMIVPPFLNHSYRKHVLVTCIYSFQDKHDKRGYLFSCRAVLPLRRENERGKIGHSIQQGELFARKELYASFF